MFLNKELVLKINLNKKSAHSSKQRATHHQTRWASLTQQISQCCVAHSVAAIYTVASTDETLDARVQRAEAMGDDVSAHKDLRKGERVGWGGVGCEQDRAGWPCIRHIHYWSAEGKQTCALEEMGGKRRGGDRLLMFLFNCETFTARAWCVATWTYQTTSAPYIFLLLLFSFTLSYPFPTQCRPVPDEPGVRLACHKKKRKKEQNQKTNSRAQKVVRMLLFSIHKKVNTV